MSGTLRTLVSKILPKRSLPYPKLNHAKMKLIDFACRNQKMRSFADLGGVWNVDGGYTFYALQRHKIDKAVLVDTDLTPAVCEQTKAYPQLSVIRGNFGNADIPSQVGKVDGVFFFDTLLHQVNPDWNDVLRMYSNTARIFLIFNQQYTSFAKTTRLLDLGPDEYARNVPHSVDEEPYRTYLRDLDAIHPQHGRPYRDIHNIWQWAITDSDLIGRVSDLGFKQLFFENCGQFGNLPQVENHAFVFVKP